MEGLITKETTVHEALERVPGAAALFEEHGVRPAPQCGPMMRVVRLKDTPDKCYVRDLDRLIDKLNQRLLQTSSQNGSGGK